jgi:hypothetical protein
MTCTFKFVPGGIENLTVRQLKIFLRHVAPERYKSVKKTKRAPLEALAFEVVAEHDERFEHAWENFIKILRTWTFAAWVAQDNADWELKRIEVPVEGA